ncbi:MAG TPA: HigA family addiction module antitoxin [Acidimicrobiales bacterium]|nr:HigA family addiction module antitoxin [Acidimicrobiales bacterium]
MTQRAALRKLLILDAADTLGDLAVAPGNHLERLRDDRARQHSIRVSQQWRICFRWTSAGPESVEIVDSHRKEGTVTPTATMSPIRPGEVLLEEYLEPLGITQHRLAVAIGVPPRWINEIVHGKRGISADTALRRAKYFGTSERSWLNLQGRYDIEAQRDGLADRLERVEPLRSA